MTIAIGQHAHTLLPGMMNRHGLVTGATGTGKTVTIHAVAEHLSALGVPSSSPMSRAISPGSPSLPATIRRWQSGSPR